MRDLLLHACCGPCSLEPVRLLRADGFNPVICWSNPNIQPAAEHDRRLATLLLWARDADVPVIVARCERWRWEVGCAERGFDRLDRCRACYAMRLAETCRVARERGFRYVSTTLAVSPYQLQDVCKDVLLKLANANGLVPVVHDYRRHYVDAQQRARELGMYRQNYCGCRFSAAEAAMERQERRDERKLVRSSR